MKKWIVSLLLMAALLTFASAEALPAWTYTGSDPVEAAVAEYTAALGQHFRLEDGAVSIPAPVIYRIETLDETHALVYGDFWVFNYVRSGKALSMISGGEYPAALTLTRTGEEWTVTEAELAEDGELFASSVERICRGDKELMDLYFSWDYDADVRPVRTRYIREYATANGLDIEAYQDYGWDAVPLKEDGDVLALLTGKTFDFSSGVGAWCTDITFGENGAFTGEFHDSDMGDADDMYPNGTVYGCRFSGRLSAIVSVDDTAWRLTVSELTMDEGQAPEAIEDGIRFITTEPYGLSLGDEVILYLPGTPVEGLPEEFIFWTHINLIDPQADALPFLSLWNEAADSGFVEIGPILGED